MKTAARLLALLAFSLLPAVAALTQTSDYEIIQSFKKSQLSLSASLKTAQDAAEVGALDGEIARLEADYSQHRKLLADGLHPENFDSAIAGLRELLKKTAERIAMAEESKKDKATIDVVSRKAETAEKRVVEVEKQNVEYRASIDKLTQEVKDLSERIEKLTQENTGLLQQIKTLQAENKKDKESIARLQQLTEKLNANIRDRDELVIKMMDSMFTEYAKPGMTDVQKKNLFVNAQGNDYVGKIVATVDGNVSYAESTVLNPQDARLVREEYRKLAAKWDGIKPFVAKIYPDEQSRTRDIATVDSRVAEWGKSIDAATWKSVRQAFADRSVDIGEFRNGDEFHSRLLAYLDAQAKQPSREVYAAFKNKVWDSPIKDQWLPVISTDQLTQKQRQEIEDRVAFWGSEIAAQVRRRVLIGVAAAALIALIAVLVLRKKKPAPAA